MFETGIGSLRPQASKPSSGACAGAQRDADNADLPSGERSLRGGSRGKSATNVNGVQSIPRQGRPLGRSVLSATSGRSSIGAMRQAVATLKNFWRGMTCSDVTAQVAEPDTALAKQVHKTTVQVPTSLAQLTEPDSQLTCATTDPGAVSRKLPDDGMSQPDNTDSKEEKISTAPVVLGSDPSNISASAKSQSAQNSPSTEASKTLTRVDSWAALRAPICQQRYNRLLDHPNRSAQHLLGSNNRMPGDNGVLVLATDEDVLVVKDAHNVRPERDYDKVLAHHFLSLLGVATPAISLLSENGIRDKGCQIMKGLFRVHGRLHKKTIEQLKRESPDQLKILVMNQVKHMPHELHQLSQLGRERLGELLAADILLGNPDRFNFETAKICNPGNILFLDEHPPVAIDNGLAVLDDYGQAEDAVNPVKHLKRHLSDESLPEGFCEHMRRGFVNALKRFVTIDFHSEAVPESVTQEHAHHVKTQLTQLKDHVLDLLHLHAA